MDSESARDQPPDNQSGSVAASFPSSGTLRQYADYLESTGVSCDMSEDSKSIWAPAARGELQRFPMELTDDADPSVVRSLLKRRGVWVVSYQLEPGTGATANCFDYVCRDNKHEIDKLPKNARRDIRRGLRSFEIRRSSWDEFVAHGFRAHADTNDRHGYAPPADDEVERMARQWRRSPCHEVWGAWADNALAAWMVVVRIDDWSWITVVRSCTDALRLCPNNALLYKITRQLLVHEKRQYVTYGLSSIQVKVAELSMHKYKVRMGYQAIPMHRRFVLYPPLRPFIQSRIGSTALEKLAGILPQSANLRKLAGMSRLLSERETSPLDWATDLASPSE